MNAPFVDLNICYQTLFCVGETQHWRPLSRHFVDASVSPAFNRSEECGECVDIIEKVWEKLASEARMDGLENGLDICRHTTTAMLYNALKFRLHAVVVRDDRCCLQLGVTDYKTSIGTTRNIHVFMDIAQRKGAAVDSYLANALGVECFTTTLDGKAVLYRRSQQVGEYAGFFCFPGGHAEPDEFMRRHLPERIDSEGEHVPVANFLEAAALLHHASSEALVDHIFNSAIREVADELGMDLRSCRNRGLISIARDSETMKPDLCFWVEVSSLALEVEACFDERVGADAFESVPRSLLLVELSEINGKEGALHFARETLGGKITPASLACLIHGVQCWLVNCRVS
ncbi:hypothetical protein ERJ75_000725700 [Trypanosoma vivax]|nr:putative nucleoside diphosphate-linked moiety X motif 22-like [Trypanosoma vivax]KAH8613876.1 hypothetical protein ERJ75_000725700 [Trypanosoma vivax]